MRILFVAEGAYKSGPTSDGFSGAISLCYVTVLTSLLKKY